MKIKGEVYYDEGVRDADFNGIVNVTVLGKKQEVKTLGNDSEPFTFLCRNNVIFNGRASVRNGLFECELPLSADIGQEPGYGKILFYAYDDISDACGYCDTLIVGGKELNNEKDNEGPVIGLYINNENFVYGWHYRQQSFVICTACRC